MTVLAVQHSAIFLLLVVLALPVATSTGPFASYSPDTYPDSLHAYNLCGAATPSALCDPNGLLNALSDSSAAVALQPQALINSALNSIESSTAATHSVCPIPTTDEEGNPHADHATGYRVSIALLERVEGQGQSERGGWAVQIFADALRRRITRGQCAEDVLIVLTVGDNELATSTGSLAATKLTGEFIHEVAQEARARYFHRRKYTEGLLYVLHAYATRLNATIVKTGSSDGLRALIQAEGWDASVGSGGKSSLIYAALSWLESGLARLPLIGWTAGNGWRWWVLAGLITLVLALTVGIATLLALKVGSSVYARLAKRRRGYTPGRASIPQSEYGYR